MWAAAHPSTGHDRAGAGADAASVAADRGVEAADRGLAGLAGRLVTVGRRPQGIEADRGGADRPTDLPAEARAPSVRAPAVRCGAVRTRGAAAGFTGAPGRPASGSRGVTAANEQRRGGLWGVVKK